MSLWDTDILLKLSALDLVQETLQLLRLSEQDIYLLPSTTHYLRKASKRLIHHYGKEGVERAQTLVQQAKPADFPVNESELELLRSVPDIDTGEALLYASAYTLQEFWLLIPIAEPEFTKVRINKNPLLKVPPACRGNRGAWFPSRSGGNLQEGGN